MLSALLLFLEEWSDLLLQLVAVSLCSGGLLGAEKLTVFLVTPIDDAGVVVAPVIVVVVVVAALICVVVVCAVGFFVFVLVRAAVVCVVVVVARGTEVELTIDVEVNADL